MVAYDGFEPTADLQDSVNGDIQRILGYGQQHPSDFGGSWLEDRHNYSVSFTDSLADHRSALEALLELPDRLQVRSCRYSYAELAEIQRTIVTEEMGLDPVTVTGVSVDQRRNVVRVGVLTEHRDVGDRLQDRFGPMITIEDGSIASAF